MPSIADWVKEINENAHSKGFWEQGNDRAIIVEKLLLIITEISEAYECLRDNPEPFYRSYHGDKPEGFSIELADCVIRIMDLCGELKLDLEQLIDIKMKYNKTRSYKHGRHPSST